MIRVILNVWDSLQNGLLSNIAKAVGEVSISPLIVGDSAFPLQTWLMKPYTNATLSPKQRYFNYRLRRTRMVKESAQNWAAKGKVEGASSKR